jgi:hypothetical protein
LYKYKNGYKFSAGVTGVKAWELASGRVFLYTISRNCSFYGFVSIWCWEILRGLTVVWFWTRVFRSSENVDICKIYLKELLKSLCIPYQSFFLLNLIFGMIPHHTSIFRCSLHFLQWLNFPIFIFPIRIFSFLSFIQARHHHHVFKIPLSFTHCYFIFLHHLHHHSLDKKTYKYNWKKK